MEVGCDGQVAMELMETFTLPNPGSRAPALPPPLPKAGDQNSPDALAAATLGDTVNPKKDPPKKKAKAAPKQALCCCVPVTLKLRTRATSIRSVLTGRQLGAPCGGRRPGVQEGLGGSGKHSRWAGHDHLRCVFGLQLTC